MNEYKRTQQKMWYLQELFSSFPWLNLLCYQPEIKGILKCDRWNVIYLISCECCGKQYVGSVTGFKERFRIHNSDVNTGKTRCGVVNHLFNICRSSASKSEYLQVQLIENVSVQNNSGIDRLVGKRKILASAIINVKPRVK